MYIHGKTLKILLSFLTSILQHFLTLTSPPKTLYLWSVEMNPKIMLNEYKSVGIFKIKVWTIYSNRMH